MFVEEFRKAKNGRLVSLCSFSLGLFALSSHGPEGRGDGEGKESGIAIGSIHQCRQSQIDVVLIPSD